MGRLGDYQNGAGLGGVDPHAIAAAKTHADRLALVGKVNWAEIKLPLLKANSGLPSRSRTIGKGSLESSG